MTLFQPNNEFALMPFYFINDTLDERELRRQIADFAAHGVGGFVIHPRIGMPRNLAWMSDELHHYYKVMLDEAEKLQLKVLLYDEAMYPSGSSCGQVVEKNPSHQCRCIVKRELEDNGNPKLGEHENLIAVCHTCSHGRIAVIDRPADSVIRGLHYHGEGPGEDEPPAADLLNTEAVDSFLNLVYDRFYDVLKEYFGSTIMGIFTDEPDLLGRCREAEKVYPGTTGILDEVNRILGYDFTSHLAALWYDDELQAEFYRQSYLKAVNDIFEQTWYARLYNWCETHNTALTGHPALSDEISPLRFFHMPGQDAVWRKLLPDTPSAIEGPDSVQGKCSSSAMIHNHRRRNINEYCGAYGHETTYEEMEWLSNWCLIRGVNLLIPHAFYYSTRGLRKDERPPDVGPNSPWWDKYKAYADSCRRLCFLNTDSIHQCETAVLCQGSGLSWKAAKVCFEHQYDFNYLEEWHLFHNAKISEDGISIEGMHYRLLIVEHSLSPEVKAVLEPLEKAGRIFYYSSEHDSELLEKLQLKTTKNVQFEPAVKALRVREVIKDNRHYLMVFNEEKDAVSTKLTLKCNSGLRHNLVDGSDQEQDFPCSLQLKGHEFALYSFSDVENNQPV